MLRWYYKWKLLRRRRRPRFDYQINGERKIGHSFHHHLYAGAAKLIRASKYNRIQIRRRKVLYIFLPIGVAFIAWFTYESYIGLKFF